LNQLTELLRRMKAGESGVRDALYAAAYADLHRLARARLREGARDVVLDTTCLVHESYLRFVSAGELRAEDRRAFFAYASQVMRSVIVDTARERIAQKRGGDKSHLVLSTKISANLADVNETVLKVHEALDALLRGIQRKGNCRDAGDYRTHGAARLGKSTPDPRGDAALSAYETDNSADGIDESTAGRGAATR